MLLKEKIYKLECKLPKVLKNIMIPLYYSSYMIWVPIRNTIPLYYLMCAKFWDKNILDFWQAATSLSFLPISTSAETILRHSRRYDLRFYVRRLAHVIFSIFSFLKSFESKFYRHLSGMANRGRDKQNIQVFIRVR